MSLGWHNPGKLKELRKLSNRRGAALFLNTMMMVILANSATASALAQRDASAEKAAGPAGVKIAHPEVPRISAPEVKRLIAERADLVIIDTQAAENYEMWHMPAAVNIPYSSTANPADRQIMLAALPMNKLIVIYCLCEEGTDSASMALELTRLGYDYDKVKVLEGGLIKWDEAGYPMIKTEVPK
jgi:rhodanese-related sulfurtransferase